MSGTISSQLTAFANSAYKSITLFLFMILPARVANVFTCLSILALILDIKYVNEQHTGRVNQQKFNELLQISYNEDIMMIPNYTLRWFWGDDFLNKTIKINNNTVTLREAIRNDEIMFKHIRYIIEILMEHIPSILRYKLNLSETRSKIAFKHNVMSLLM